MNHRQRKLIRKLTSKNMYLSELAKYLNVSERTIRNDIKQINGILIKYDSYIEKDDDKRYKLKSLDEKIFWEFKEKVLYPNNFNFNEPKNRILYIKLKYLFADEYIKLDDFLDELYVSRSTIQNDFLQVKGDLNKYNLKFDFKPNYGMKIIGIEANIRKAISDIIYNTTFAYKFLDNRQDLLSIEEVDINKINKIVIDNVRKSEIDLSDLDLNNLVIHIAIAMKRIEKNIYINEKMPKEISENKEYLISKSIVYDLEKEFFIKFPEEELYYITMHLLGTRLYFNKYIDENEEDNFQNSIGNITKEIINKVQDILDYKLDEDKELFYGIVNHLKPAIYRLKNKMNIRNPLINSIKKNYSDIFNASLISSKIIEEKFNVKLNEDEIGYLAIHFGAALERVKLSNPQLRVLLVCTTGLGSSQLLKYKLKVKFDKKISIIGVTQYYNLDEYNIDDYDIIISTISFNNNSAKPCIVISDIFGESEFQILEKYLNNQSIEQKQNYLKKEDIYINLDIDNKNDIIKFLCNKLVQKGKATEKLFYSILEREKVANTGYGNLVAVPHPIKPMSEETFISIAVLNKEINWGEKLAQIIILLCIGKDENRDLQNMYNKLLNLADEEDNVRKILNASTREEILELFNNM